MPGAEDDIKRRFAAVELRVQRLENEIGERNAALVREADQRRREFVDMLAGARRSLESTIAQADVVKKVDELYVLGSEAKEERIKRVERERLALEAKTQAAEAKAERDKSFQRYLQILTGVTALIIAIGGAVGACSFTHSKALPTTGDAHAH
jgi:hypothetical protein